MTTKAAQLRDQINTRLAKGRELAKRAEDEARDFTDEERATVKSLFDEAKGLAAELKSAQGNDENLEALLALGKGIDRDTLLPAPGLDVGDLKTAGERFVEGTKDYFGGLVGTKSGTISKESRVHTPAVGFKGLDDLFERFGRKALVTGADLTSGGALITPQRVGGDLVGTFQREITLLDVITRGTTDSDAVEYPRITGFTNNAAAVAEATSSAPPTAPEAAGALIPVAGGGYKPESGMTLEVIKETVKTVAHWMPATKRALSDAAQLRTIIDAFLLYGLEEALEDQIVAGDDVGENFEGILSVDGVQAQAFDTDILTTIRKAITKVRVNGKARVNAIGLHPADDERIDLLTNANGDFYFGGPVAQGATTVWGRPRVVSEAIPEGSAIVADWRYAVLWDREDAAVQATDSHADFFIRNLVAILAELRAAFGILRAPAFCVADLTA